VLLPDTQRLRSDFNNQVTERRVLAIVSPTCGDCRAGPRLVLDAVGERRTVSLFVLWTGMLAGDTAEAASSAAEQTGYDRKVWHYWEDEGWPVSTRLRAVLRIGPYDPTRSAWDVYLLYPNGPTWSGEDPPVPVAWAYNLRDDLRSVSDSTRPFFVVG
jgi:hypothetical protein